MCVIIHKPAGVAIPAPLLTAAASLNRDGWGLMGFDAQGEIIVERHERVDTAELIAAEARYRDCEYALHIRLMTRGSTHEQNVHPLPLADGSYLMHNGTLPVEPSVFGRSDSWHLATQVLSPLLERDPQLLVQPAFQELISLALGPDNRVVLLHAASRKLYVFNSQLGSELDGLWVSNTRWIDQRLYHLPEARQPQERSLIPEHLRFI